MKQAVLDNVIDWENSELPEWDTLSVDDFTFSYNARLSLLDGLSSELGDSFADKFLNGEGIRDDVPFEGKSYELGGKVLGSFPQIGAGEQKIKVTFKGNSLRNRPIPAALLFNASATSETSPMFA